MSPDERDVLRSQIDRRRRVRIAQASSGIAPARAPKRLMAELIVERPRPKGWCQFCGAPTKGDVCMGHRDLVA